MTETIGPTSLRPLAVQDGGDRAALQLLARLRPGQELAARVVAPTADGQVRLRLNGVELLATTSLRLNAGERLRLVVAQGPPQPVLRLLPETAPGRDLALLARQALARQQPPAALASQAQALSSDKVGIVSPLARQVLDSLTRPGLAPNDLDAPTLRRALETSGLFMEARLARGLPPAPDDRKLELLRLLRALRAQPRAAVATQDAPGASSSRATTEGLFERLAQLVEAGVNRIQHHQVASLASEDPTRGVWRIDLPLQQGERRDELQLRIRREARTSDPAEADWEAEVHFDFEETGPLNVRVGFRQGQVSCAFRAERPDTVRRFTEALPTLQQRLQDAGLRVSALGCVQGGARSPDAELPRGLLDEQA